MAFYDLNTTYHQLVTTTDLLIPGKFPSYDDANSTPHFSIDTFHDSSRCYNFPNNYTNCCRSHRTIVFDIMAICSSSSTRINLPTYTITYALSTKYTTCTFTSTYYSDYNATILNSSSTYSSQSRPESPHREKIGQTTPLDPNTSACSDDQCSLSFSWFPYCSTRPGRLGHYCKATC